MKIIHNLSQNTQDWHQFRKNHIGASMAPIIMGESPWSTPYKLWSQMLGLSPPDECNDRMQRGLDLESKARACYEEKMKLKFNPCVGVSCERDYLSASFDGFNLENGEAVEIKCPGSSDHLFARSGRVPFKYIAQLQHQIYVGELDYIDYFSYVSNDDNVVLVVNRHDLYIQNMLKKEKEFWDCLQSFTPPELTDKDFRVYEDEETPHLVEQYQYYRDHRKEYEKMEEIYRLKLIEKAADQSSIISGLRVTRYPVKGKVDNKRLYKELGIREDDWRKETTNQWRLSEI